MKLSLSSLLNFVKHLHMHSDRYLGMMENEKKYINMICADRCIIYKEVNSYPHRTQQVPNVWKRL